MIESALGQISFFSLFLSGIRDSINAASLLGMVFFSFFLVRYEKETGIGGACAIVLLVTFFMIRFLLFFGLMDVFFVYLPAGVFAVYVIRMFLAVCCVMLGVVLFLKLRQGSQAAALFLKDVYWARLPAQSSFSFLKRGLKIVTAFFWGIFFGVVFGLWPSTHRMPSFVYQDVLRRLLDFIYKVFFFDLISFVPFFIVFFLIMKGLLSQDFRQRVMNSRLMLLIFSGLFIAIGCGAFFAHFESLVN